MAKAVRCRYHGLARGCSIFTTGVFGCEELDDPFYRNESIASAAGDIVLDQGYKLLPSCGGEDHMHHFKLTLDQATEITTHYKIVYLGYGDG